ncbi:DNA ligase 3 [Carabus blaptoides fortunei]
MGSKSRQLVKLFSIIFGTNREDMAEHLEQGDIGETIQHFFEHSNKLQPSKKSLLTMQEVDDFLEELSQRTKEEEQMDLFKKITKKCTGNDLKTIIRLIKHDLRMNAGAKHVLDAVHPDAYEAFQASRDLPSVLKRIMGNKDCLSSSDKSVKATIKVMTAVLPMLAEACKSIEQAMRKCPNGMYSEIKYDGERVQVHKQGSEFKYFSRSLKPVMAHKVNHFKDYIPQAFPHAKDLILDSEVLLIDTNTGKPLPFGSLGVHKREEFKDANVCLFVFDCIFYNGESLMHKPMHERRRILHENMTEIPNHIMFSEMEEVHAAADLAAMITKVLKEGLEGLVLKDLMSIYEPGKRHWLKVKKDYLCDGAMADTADLIVLGAWFGTGKKGGMMSVFLMGCYDPYTRKFCTVTKVHTGHDDKRLEQLQTELDMVKISSDVSKVPDWLECTRTMVPDFVARDPKKQPVWEITGAEFTQHDVHTADGISIRFPRVTRIRDDKDWQTATNREELRELFKKSKENTDFSLLTKTEIKSEDRPGPSNKGQIKLDTFIVKKEKDIETESDIKQEEKDAETKTIKRKSDNFNKKPLKKIKLSESSEDLLMNNKIENDNSKIKYPVIFENIKLLALEEVKQDHEDILRHFVAVGGDLIMADECEQATHVVHVVDHVSDISGHYPRQARHITVDWIRDSIGNNEIQDARPYAVQWIPT